MLKVKLLLSDKIYQQLHVLYIHISNSILYQYSIKVMGKYKVLKLLLLIKFEGWNSALQS